LRLRFGASVDELEAALRGFDYELALGTLRTMRETAAA